MNKTPKSLSSAKALVAERPDARDANLAVPQPAGALSPAEQMVARVSAAAHSTFVSLVRSGPLTVAAIVCAAVALSLVGAALVVAQGVDNATIRWRGGVETIIFLNPEADNAAVTRVGDDLRADPNVAEATFVSQSDAYDEFTVMFRNSPDLIASVGPDALPSSWRIVPADTAEEADVVALGESFSNQADIYEVVYAKDAVASVLAVSDMVRKALLTLAIALIGVQLLLVFAAARAAVYARRDELAIMRLVGAPRWLVRVPFLAEGAVCGAIGGAIAGGLTWIGVRVIEQRVGDGTSLAILSHFNVGGGHTRNVAFALIAGGMLIGVIGAGVATARYIRVGDGRAPTVRGRINEARARRHVMRRLADEAAAGTGPAT